jgi:hypothetical protein
MIKKGCKYPYIMNIKTRLREVALGSARSNTEGRDPDTQNKEGCLDANLDGIKSRS